MISFNASKRDMRKKNTSARFFKNLVNLQSQKVRLVVTTFSQTFPQGTSFLVFSYHKSLGLEGNLKVRVLDIYKLQAYGFLLTFAFFLAPLAAKKLSFLILAGNSIRPLRSLHPLYFSCHFKSGILHFHMRRNTPITLTLLDFCKEDPFG